MQSAYSQQCIGILIVSLACSTLCHVLRENSNRLNSCANKQFNTCYDGDTMAAKKSSQILCTGEKQFLTRILKSRAFPRLRNEERVRGQKIPSIADETKIIRALPMHRNNYSLLRKHNSLCAKSPEIILKHPKVNPSKRLWINDLYLESYSNSLKSFQRVVLRSELEPNYVFNCQIFCLRILPIRIPDFSKENQHIFYSRNLWAGLMNGKIIRTVCTFKNCPFRGTRINKLQTDIESIFQSSHRNNFSRLFRTMKKIDHVRESRSVTYTSIEKLLSLNTLPVQNQNSKRGSYADVTTMNDGFRLYAEHLKIMTILKMHRHYTGYNSHSLILTYLEGRLISPHSACYQLFIPTYNRYLNYKVNYSLKHMNIERNFTIFQSDLIQRTLYVQNDVKKHISEVIQLFNRNCKRNYVWSFVHKQVIQGQTNYMGNREAKIDILRLDLYNRRKGEHMRTDKQNNKITYRLGSEETIAAKERFDLQIRTHFLPKYVNCKIYQHSLPFHSSENNCEKMHKENMQRMSRNKFSPENNSQKEIACMKRMVKNYRQNFRSPDKSTVLIEYKRINVHQELGWKNYIGSIFQLHRLTNKSKGVQNKELENIDSMYSEHGKNTISMWSACNKVLQYLILMVLYTLHS
ncbi:uncharacterized protein LOC117181611 [Belonocnema kinseyi]|uniref:uncharacterized protein LOC117181611 n=1 Tax=Belonocnema kinseyi TaxID=2817044 RepID=UPI00143DD159|nr:uncharacterized protein LOC117181611 [Belonocnema kinseyi]